MPKTRMPGFRLMRGFFLRLALLYRHGMRMRENLFYKEKYAPYRINPIIRFYLDKVVYYCRKMPTAIYDASYITFRRRAGVLYGYKNNINTAAATNYNIVRKEQPTLQTGEIITTRRQGGCIAAQDASGVAFNRQNPGPCCGGV